MASEGRSGSGVGTDEAAELTPEQLSRLAAVPSGAAVLAGVSVGLLLLGWLLLYFLIYLPRGMVG